MEVLKFLGGLFVTLLVVILILPWILLLLGKYLDWVFSFTQLGRKK